MCWSRTEVVPPITKMSEIGQIVSFAYSTNVMTVKRQEKYNLVIWQRTPDMIAIIMVVSGGYPAFRKKYDIGKMAIKILPFII